MRSMRILAVVVSIAVSGAAAVPAGAQAVRERRPLSFGRIAKSNTTGAVTIAPSSGLDCGPHTCLGGHAAARFVVLGFPLQRFDVRFSTGDSLSNGSDSVPLQNLVDRGGGTLRLNAGGRGRLDVGGQLLIGSENAGGAYAGSYEIFLESQ